MKKTIGKKLLSKEKATIVGLFLVLFFSYNCTIRNLLYSSELIDALFIAVSVLLLGFSILKAKKLSVSMIIICTILISTIFLRNGDIQNGNYGMPAILFWAIALLFILSTSDSWFRAVEKIIIIFTIEHVFSTWFFYLFKELYYDSFTTLFDSNTMWLLRYEAKNGLMAGLTAHYSTNSIYLSIGVIWLSFSLLKDKSQGKSRKGKLLLLLLTIGALLLTGKRAQPIICIFALIISYLISNINKLLPNILKIVSCILAFASIILVISIWIPELLNTYTRMEQLSNSNDFTNGRSEMYDLAIQQWNNHPLLGKGWGTFKYSYSDNLKAGDGYTLKDAHNIYLQLLAETGIIGFFIYISLFAVSLLLAISVVMRLQKENENDHRKLIYYSSSALATQLFFLLYGITGNPLYDCQILFPYIIAIALIVSIKNNINHRRKNEKNRNTNISANC